MTRPWQRKEQIMMKHGIDYQRRHRMWALKEARNWRRFFYNYCDECDAFYKMLYEKKAKLLKKKLAGEKIMSEWKGPVKCEICNRIDNLPPGGHYPLKNGLLKYDAICNGKLKPYDRRKVGG